MSNVETWNKVDGNNVDPLKTGWPEGMKRSDVNDRARELMGALRRWYDDPEFLDLARDASGDALTIAKFSDTVVRVENFDMTPYTAAGRRLRMRVGAGAWTYAHIISSVFSTHTDITVGTFSGDSSVVPNGVDELEFHHSQTLGKLAFLNVQSFGFYLPSAPTAAGIQAAIDEANTAGGGIVLLGDGAYTLAAGLNVKNGVVLYGGATGGATLTTDAALAVDAIVMQSRSACIGFTLACGAQTPGAYDAIRIATSADECVVQDVRIEAAPRHGLNIGASGNTQVGVRGLTVDAPDTHGVLVQDALDDAVQIVLDGITVVNPGSGSTNDVAGIYAAGSCRISNVTVTCLRTTPKSQRGVWLATKDATGTKEAKLCTVTGVNVTGTGDLARGVEIAGEYCSVSGGAISLSGSTSRGVIIDSTGAGQVANFNVVTGLVITAADIGVHLESDADDNVVEACVFNACISNAISCDGDHNLITGNRIKAPAGGVTSINITAAATKNEITRNSIEHVSGAGVGIALVAGSDESIVAGNTIRDCATGLTIADGATNTAFRENVFRGCTTYFTDADDTTSSGFNDPYPTHFKQISNAAQIANFAITSSFSMTTFVDRLPGPIPDGEMWWRFHVEATLSSVNDTRDHHVALKVGPDGTTTDTTVGDDEVTFGPTTKSFSIPASDTKDAEAFEHSGFIYYKPDAGDKYYGLAIRMNSGSETVNIEADSRVIAEYCGPTENIT